MMGDKIQAKKIAKKYGLPVIEGSDGGISDIDEAKKEQLFGYDEAKVEIGLNDFILKLLAKERADVGALYDTMQSGGGSATPPVSTEGFGELRVN